MTPTDKEIRKVVTDVLATGEAYSAEVWLAWGLRGGDQVKRTGMAKVQRVLRRMEDDGLIVGRDVLPEEHRESQYARRYYRLTENKNV